MPTKALLELYFGGDWHAMSGNRVYSLGSHTPVPWTMVLTSMYGMLRMQLRLSEGGLFIASLTYEDFDEPLVVSAGAVFTEAINCVVRAYTNTVKSLPQPCDTLPDERGAYYRQHLKLKRGPAK
jgi:hypothetical protein